MNTQLLTWRTTDGLQIFGKIWPVTKPKAVICLLHGMGEHIGRYEHVAKFLNTNGYAVIGCDHRGHGQSEGQRGHFPDFDIFLNDVDCLLEQASRQFPNLPKVLYGHSMGGNLLANYLLRRKPNIAGAILSSPYLQLAFQPPAAKLWLGKLMKGILPTLALASGLEVEAISRDIAVVQAYKADPLVHDKISAKMGIELIEAGQWALDHAHELAVPTLLYHGTADRLTSCDASKVFASKTAQYTTFISYESLYHETHNEPEKETVLKNMVSWLDGLIGAVR